MLSVILPVTYARLNANHFFLTKFRIRKRNMVSIIFFLRFLPAYLVTYFLLIIHLSFCLLPSGEEVSRP
jgi:hypothetical protein